MSAPAAPLAPPSMPNVLWTADEVAARFQVPKAQIYRLAREGRLPVVHVGRYYRFRPADVEAWEAAGGAAPESESVRPPLYDGPQSPRLPSRHPGRAA